MQKIKVLIVDDEPDALELMESLLQKFPQVVVTGTSLGHKNAIFSMLQQQPDVIFQDIEMDGLNGIELVDEYRKHNFEGKIVFVTAHVEYSIQAIRKAAYDYLLKPVDIDELENLILRLLADQQKPTTSEKKIKIYARDGLFVVRVEDIVFCKADGNYTKMMLKDASKNLVVSKNIGVVEEEINQANFCRVSRSTLVNTNYLEKIDKSSSCCKLTHWDKEIKVSHSKLKELEALV